MIKPNKVIPIESNKIELEDSSRKLPQFALTKVNIPILNLNQTENLNKDNGEYQLKSQDIEEDAQRER